MHSLLILVLSDDSETHSVLLPNSDGAHVDFYELWTFLLKDRMVKGKT